MVIEVVAQGWPYNSENEDVMGEKKLLVIDEVDWTLRVRTLGIEHPFRHSTP